MCTPFHSGKFGETSNGKYILIFKNDIDDEIIYSTYENSNIDLLGFGEYTEPNVNENAKNRAYFRGTINNLKKFIRFTSIIRFGSTLRILEETKTVNATGERDTIDFENGLITYNISFSETRNMTNIIGIDCLHDYKFSDDENNFPSTASKVNILSNNINLTNKDKDTFEFVEFRSDRANVVGNTFSFDFILSSNKILNITTKEPVYLNYSSLEDLKRYEIECSIEKNNNLYTVLCAPKKDVHTPFSSLIINIPNGESTRLRFLSSSENNTFYAPSNANGEIMFTYNPEINTFGRKTSKNRGLSAGAIVAIVLATIAAVVAVGVAFFFLNKIPVNSTVKNPSDLNLQNSQTNINN